MSNAYYEPTEEELEMDLKAEELADTTAVAEDDGAESEGPEYPDIVLACPHCNEHVPVDCSDLISDVKSYCRMKFNAHIDKLEDDHRTELDQHKKARDAALKYKDKRHIEEIDKLKKKYDRKYEDEREGWEEGLAKKELRITELEDQVEKLEEYNSGEEHRLMKAKEEYTELLQEEFDVDRERYEKDLQGKFYQDKNSYVAQLERNYDNKVEEFNQNLKQTIENATPSTVNKDLIRQLDQVNRGLIREANLKDDLQRQLNALPHGYQQMLTILPSLREQLSNEQQLRQQAERDRDQLFNAKNILQRQFDEASHHASLVPNLRQELSTEQQLRQKIERDRDQLCNAKNNLQRQFDVAPPLALLAPELRKELATEQQRRQQAEQDRDQESESRTILQGKFNTMFNLQTEETTVHGPDRQIGQISAAATEEAEKIAELAGKREQLQKKISHGLGEAGIKGRPARNAAESSEKHENFKHAGHDGDQALGSSEKVEKALDTASDPSKPSKPRDPSDLPTASKSHNSDPSLSSHTTAPKNDRPIGRVVPKVYRIARHYTSQITATSYLKCSRATNSPSTMKYEKPSSATKSRGTKKHHISEDLPTVTIWEIHARLRTCAEKGLPLSIRLPKAEEKEGAEENARCNPLKWALKSQQARSEIILETPSMQDTHLKTVKFHGITETPITKVQKAPSIPDSSEDFSACKGDPLLKLSETPTIVIEKSPAVVERKPVVFWNDIFCVLLVLLLMAASPYFLQASTAVISSHASQGVIDFVDVIHEGVSAVLYKCLQLLSGTTIATGVGYLWFTGTKAYMDCDPSQ